MTDDRGQRLAPGAHTPPRPEGVPRTPIPAEIAAARDEVSRMLRDQNCDWPHALTDEQLTAAILRALPTDHDDHTTVTRITPNAAQGYPNVTWGRPEWLAAEILTSIRAAEQDQT